MVMDQATDGHLDVDLLVLGGGSVGAGVAREATLWGLRVCLVDTHDFASGTSHYSSKLIHGGIRYLEQGRIGLVFESLRERNRLLRYIAPHLVKPLRFVFPFRLSQWWRWAAVAIGGFLYDCLALFRGIYHTKMYFGKKLRTHLPALDEGYRLGVTFGDAKTNDARLVMHTLLTAEACGAMIYNYAELKELTLRDSGYVATILSPRGSTTVYARLIVNATGPWATITAAQQGWEEVLQTWVKGSHITLPRPADFPDTALICQSPSDGRVVFVIPWQTVLLVGTTEEPYTEDLRGAVCSAREVRYLLAIVNHYFPRYGFSATHVQCAYAGVRPLFGQKPSDMNKLSRKHVIKVDLHKRMIAVWGGKLTTFRQMAEEVLEHAAVLLNVVRPSRKTLSHFRTIPLHGVQSPDVQAQWVSAKQDATCSPVVLKHLIQQYGERANLILPHMVGEAAEPLFSGLPYTLAELGYLAETEHVMHLADVLKRRTPIYFLAPQSGCGMLRQIASYVGARLGWNADRTTREIAAYCGEVAANMAWQKVI